MIELAKTEVGRARIAKVTERTDHYLADRVAEGDQPYLGKVARRAAIFSDAMCEIILSGFSAQMKADQRM